YRKWVSYELLRKRSRKENVKAGEPLRGIGISTAFQGNGFINKNFGGDCTVELTMEKNGNLEIKTSLASTAGGLLGPGYLNNWQILARDILGVEPEYVKLICNTTEAPDSGPGTLSRNIFSVTKLVERCCTAIRKQRTKDPLPITVRRSEKPGKTPVHLQDKNIEPEALANPSWASAVAEIEIDPVSLEPIIRGIWFVVDGGKIINKQRACRCLKTGIIHALGWTCREFIRYENGKIPVEYYRNYDIAATEEIPPIELGFINNDSPNSKGIGELPFNCLPAAYVQAVSQAMDHHFERIPLDVREIWDAWRLKNTESPE
ncbi:MAG: molybdopterin-dependent oxidoreductase, partial [Treponema sp.]|nr:molybdopterin-dependent oxidoreductase [Treponema sp.]